MRHSRDGHGHHAVLTADVPHTLIKDGNNNRIDLQIVQADSSGDNIHDGVHRADLMEVNLLQCCAMCRRLCLPEDRKDADGKLSCTL